MNDRRDNPSLGGVPFKVYCAIEIEKREDLWYTMAQVQAQKRDVKTKLDSVVNGQRRHNPVLLAQTSQSISVAIVKDVIHIQPYPQTVFLHTSSIPGSRRCYCLHYIKSEPLLQQKP